MVIISAATLVLFAVWAAVIFLVVFIGTRAGAELCPLGQSSTACLQVLPMGNVTSDTQ